MAFQVVSFQIPRANDRIVFDGMTEAIKKAGYEPTNIVASLFLGINLSYQDAAQHQQFDEVLNLETVAIGSFAFHLSSKVQVSVKRSQENSRLKGWYDDVSINPGEAADPKRLLTLITEARKCLHAVEEMAAFDFLTDEQRRYYEAREMTLQRQEQMVQHFFGELQRFSIALTNDFQQKQKHQDEENVKWIAALEEQHQRRVKQLDKREADLEKRNKEIDDRESKHVRREIYKEIRNKFVERSKAFELTKGTQRLRIPIYFSSLVLLILLLAGVVYYVFIDSPWNRQHDAWILGAAIARQLFLTLGFGLTAWFIIRWQNKWFHDHAEEEFKLKRLELDIDRASWVVEMAMEWKDAKGTEIPQFLIERLSRNLFEEDKEKDGVLTPADSLASAMLRAASGAKVKLGDAVELSFDPKSIKKLDKEPKE